MTTSTAIDRLLPMVESKQLPIRYPEFAARLSQAMAVAPIEVQGIVDFFKARGEKITYEMVRRYTLGQAMPRQEKLNLIAEAVGRSASELVYGASEPKPGKHSLPEDQGNVLVWGHPDDLPPDDNRVWLDTYDYRFSAGTGLIQWEVRQKKALPFDIGFFRALGSKPKDCKLVRVHGDSMEPYLFDRDMIMVDTAKNIIRDGKVYAIYFADEPLVKQIFKEAGGAITLHSINSGKYPDKTIGPEHLDSVSIMGEVIYRSGSGWAGGN
ncbi:S24 family peptidase [Burkholderia vietnamiensis]|uniref:S24 family peptidase n=1 Tax=Burkholderia vietnamiensis TaxID=60552 RepID=UPI0020126701|nr:S24 family peptidase [Burkholderia vietnamiensis]